MPDTRKDLRPGPRPRTVRTADRELLDVPAGWELLPPGDAALTRAVKAAGPTWSVSEKKGRRTFSKGVWAPAAHIEAAREAVEAKRADPAHQRKLDQARRRREAKHTVYVREFEAAVLAFLRFHPAHAAAAAELARRVTAVATPVGSGTVGRTERIPIEKRAEAAVIAWMRHQTTAYDDTSVARVKGARRELRRKLAARSRAVLRGYREGGPVPPGCPLAAALAEPAAAAEPAPDPTLPRRPARAPQRPPEAPRRAARPPTARDPRRRTPAATPAPSPAPPHPTTEGPAPRDAHEEAQRALYLKVLARRRGR
jgi:hypothetical protein